MDRFHSYYERKAPDVGLPRAIIYTALMAGFLVIGAMALAAFHRSHESFFLFLGVFNCIIGPLGTLHGAMFIRVIVRGS